MFYQTGEALRSRLLHTEHGRKLRHLFQLGPRLLLAPALFELLLAASSDPARLSVRWFSGLEAAHRLGDAWCYSRIVCSSLPIGST